MIAARLLPPTEPFASDNAGSDYFLTEFHYRQLAATLSERLRQARGFVLIEGDPAPDGEMLAQSINGDRVSRFRASFVRCKAGMDFDDLVRSFSRQLGVAPDGEGGSLWPLISHLMLESRKGITRVLVVENAEALDDQVFDELYRFAKVDDPHLLPVALLSSPAFAGRLDASPLRFLKSAVSVPCR